MNKNKKYCPVCGAELDIDAIICTTCGEHILGDARSQEATDTQNVFETDSEKLKKYCPFCGEIINADAVKCKYCKNFIEEESGNGKAILVTIFNTLVAFALAYKIGLFLFSGIDFKNIANNNTNATYT